MKNYLISEAIGDIAGSAYEGRSHRIKDYNKVKLFSSRAHFTDDTMLIFACAEAFIDNLDMTMNLWKCAYAYYEKMPDSLIYQVMKIIPDWMVEVSERLDEIVNSNRQA